MMKAERKNRENLGQEIFFGNLFRKLKNVSRLAYIFTIFFTIFFSFFVIHGFDFHLFWLQVQNVFEFIKTHSFFGMTSSGAKQSKFG